MDDSHRHASPHDSTGRVADAEPADTVVRPLATLAAYQACVELQAAVWGAEFDDAVPAHSPAFDVAEDAILVGAAVLAESARRASAAPAGEAT